MHPDLPNPDFQKKIETLCAFPEAQPQFKKELNLRLQTNANLKRQKRKSLSLPRLAIVIPTIVIFITAATTFLLGPQKVWAAVHSLVGFIPGIGFVQENNPIRSLLQPVQQTQEGVTVTIQDTIVTESSTFINILVDGILSYQVIEAGTPQQSSQLQLYLPDGTTIALKGYNISFMEKEPAIQLVFETLPPEINQINLTFESIPGIPRSLSPIGWSFPIELSANPPPDRSIPARSLNLLSGPEFGLIFKINSIAYLHDNTAIELELVSNNPNVTVSQNWWNAVAVYDENDRYYPFTGIPIYNLDNQDIITVFTDKLEPSQVYSISISNGFQLIHQIPKDDEFVFELDPNAAADQSWELNRQFNIDNYSITLTKAKLVRADDDLVVLKFQFDTESDLTNLMVIPVDDEPAVTRIFPDGIEFNNFPTHSMRFRINSYQTFISGNWKVIVPALP